MYFFSNAFLLFLFVSILSSCVLTDFAHKTKNTFSDGATYLKDKSKKAYGASKRALGIEYANSNSIKPMSVSKRKFDDLPDGTELICSF